LPILRAIRFANRFNFKICQDIIDAAHLTEVKDAFNLIAVERKANQLDKILAGNQPQNAIL
jgi:tRNA nucleotidyltransferase/poly(A) polymerase